MSFSNTFSPRKSISTFLQSPLIILFFKMRFAFASVAIPLVPLVIAAPSADLLERTAGNVCEQIATPYLQ